MLVGVYQIRIRFEKLFADPLIFEEPQSLVRRYLLAKKVPLDKAGYLHQLTREAVSVDDSGKPSVVSGTATYRVQGKRVRSEFMVGANLTIEYVDFGSGVSPEEHEHLWKRNLWGRMRFEVKSFTYETAAIELPDPDDLYKMLLERATPTTIATVDLASVPERLFLPTASYLGDCLRNLAEKGKETVEVYPSSSLTAEERKALEKRIGREAGPSTMFVILSRKVSVT